MKIAVGKIVKPQGVKGELKVYPADNNLSIYKNLKKVFINNKEIEIKKLIVRQDFLYLSIPGVNDRNTAETLRNTMIYADQEDLSLSENTFFIDDLINADVVDQNDNFIGIITQIENYGSADILTILEENREYCIPFLTSIVLNVKNNKIVVDKTKYNEVKICE